MNIRFRVPGIRNNVQKSYNTEWNKLAECEGKWVLLFTTSYRWFSLAQLRHMTEFRRQRFAFLRASRCIIIESILDKFNIRTRLPYDIWTDERSIYQGHFRRGIASKQSTRKWRRKPHFSEIRLALTDVNIEDSSCQMAPKTLFWCRVNNNRTANWRPACQRWLLWKKLVMRYFLAWITIRPISAVVDILTYDSFSYVAIHTVDNFSYVSHTWF